MREKYYPLVSYILKNVIVDLEDIVVVAVVVVVAAAAVVLEIKVWFYNIDLKC